MEIIYTKEGKRIIHPTGVNQLLTLEDLYRCWEHAKAKEKEAEQYAERIHDDIKKVEALQEK